MNVSFFGFKIFRAYTVSKKTSQLPRFQAQIAVATSGNSKFKEKRGLAGEVERAQPSRLFLTLYNTTNPYYKLISQTHYKLIHLHDLIAFFNSILARFSMILRCVISIKVYAEVMSLSI